MTWKTHKHGAFSATLLFYPIVLGIMHQLALDKYEYILLSLIAYIVLFNGAHYGTIFPDLDHGNPRSIPSRNAFTLTINKVIHALPWKVSHRAWQTHSCDLYIIIFTPMIYLSYTKFQESLSIVYMLTSILFLGFMGGALIHCFMDMFTRQGVWVSIIWARLFGGKRGYTKYRVSLAPTWFWYPMFNFKRGFHKVFPVPEPITGGEYENGFRVLVTRLNRVYLVITVAMYLRPWWSPYAEIGINYFRR